MAELIELIFFVVLFAVLKFIQWYKLDNYDHRRVDEKKLGMDVCKGVSISERRRRYVSGCYDKD